ncbi:probable serine/threonine-protein kinase DDB_G0278509 [Contarinia nasturtii]|uniref:probable serine/threonine-protein kinase DDB_G0278509 n=1 Tax=Contarinia nasturtii TaxID=265458 RepID=UPI0012D43F12|nr:probable serine/threonine-protein kinase DDB_G0278509 [Contarinia nasturtii]
MNDPNTINCRIYVGNLKENTTKPEIQNIFSKYGSILGIMLSRNFGFIQFESETSANNAIDNENQKVYNGRKITVSKVQKKGAQKQMDKGPPTNNASNPDTGSQSTQNNPVVNTNPPIPSSNNANSIPSSNNNNALRNNNNMGNMGNVSQMQNTSGNHQSRQQQPIWRNRNNNRNNMNNEMSLHTDRERSPQRREGNNDRWNQDNQGSGNFNHFRNNNRNNNNMVGHNNMGNMMNQMINIKKETINNSSGAGGSGIASNMANNSNNTGNQQTFGFPTDNFKSVLNGGILRGYASAREIRAKYPNANDCEIVVLEKHLVDYAEYIESRLKRAAITADLLFPNADLTIGKMLTNISNRGALYAVIIQPQHKENNSVTLNILYGIPAEHRNMPLEDAIALIIRNYQHLCQGENGDVIGDTDESPYASIPMANVRHPDSVQHLINLLADNRTLTVLQLDCILKYLQERREAQYKFELGDTNLNVQQTSAVDNKSTVLPNEQNKTETSTSAAPVEPPKVNPEEEIQKKILEILNKPSIPNIKPDTSADKLSIDKKQPATITSELSSTNRQEPKLLAKDPNLRNVLDSLMLDDI